MQLNWTIKELIEVVGGTTSLDPSFFIEKISSLELAGHNDLALFFEPQEGSVFDPPSRALLKNSKAGVIITKTALEENKPYVLVNDPLYVFQKIVAHKADNDLMHNRSSFFIHSSAVVDDHTIVEEGAVIDAHAVIQSGARIGVRARIGAGSFIGKHCVIGGDVIIHPRVTILDRCIIGERSIIHSGAVIGSDGYGYHIGRSGLRKVPQIGIVRLGKDVEIGSNTTIDRAAFTETIIGDGVKIDNLVHIAHNVRIGAHTAIIAQTGIAGGTMIGSGCQIGGQVGIKDHLTIGAGAKIVSKSGVMRDVAPGEVVAGIPAVSFALWKRIAVSLTQLPEFLKVGKTFQATLSASTKSSFLKRWFGL